MCRVLRLVVLAVRTGLLGAFLLLVVGPGVVRGVGTPSCARWASRDVAPLETSVGALLETVAETPTFTVPIPGRFGGVSLPGATLFQRESSGLVLVHEAVHHIQMDDEGLFRYAWRYAHEWVAGLYAGCSPYGAYRSVGYELQARGAVEALPRTLRDLARGANGPEDLDGLFADSYPGWGFDVGSAVGRGSGRDGG